MAGLLGDIYSTIDSTKRKLSDFVQNPVESTRQFIFNRNEDAGKQLGLLDQSFRGANGQLTIGPQTPQAQAAHNQLTDGLLSAMMGATVWHGSPHKFNKFDSSKIGTGEGAQAYGHGLYLAESPDVAKSYQTTLTMDRGFNFGGKSGLTREQLQDLVNAREGGKYLDGVTKPSGVADQVIDSIVYGKNGELPRGYKYGSERAALFEKLKQEIAHTDEGALYKVDLPDEHIAKMLDWDKPLSQQPQAFKDAVSAREQQRMMPILEQRRATLAGLPQGAENASILKKQIAILEDEITQPQAVPNMTGGEYFNYLRNREMAPAEQADWLRKAGIPGIRYLDGGSRGTGAGTSNYVVFPGNEDILKILERNGKGLLD